MAALWESYLTSSLAWSISTHKLHKLFEWVLPRVVVVADGGVSEVRARLLDDGGRGKVQR